MQKSQKVLIQLDALLDTRLGAAFRAGATEIDWDGYFKRTHSKLWEFFGLEEEVFLDAYRRRNVGTLEVSKATLLLKQLPYVMRNKLVTSISSPIHERPELHINYYPYNLSQSAVAMFRQAIFDSLPTESRMRVIMVYVPTERITAQYLKDHFCDFILYDLTEWMEINAKSFEETPIPEVSVIYPATLNCEDINKFSPSNENDDPFESMRLMLSMVLGVQGINPRLLSLDPCLLSQPDLVD